MCGLDEISNSLHVLRCTDVPGIRLLGPLARKVDNAVH